MAVSKGDNNSLALVLTRPKEQSRELAEKLSDLGFEVIIFPTITIEIAPLSEQIRAALQELRNGAFNWIVFTSANGVRALSKLQIDFFDEKFLPSDTKVAVVGKKTGEEVRKLFGRGCDLVPRDEQATGLIAEFGSRLQSGERVLLAGARESSGVVETELQKLGAVSTKIAVYETQTTEPSAELIQELLKRVPEKLALVFYSPSAFRGFLKAFANSAQRFRGSKIVSLGPVTSQAIRTEGFPVGVELDQKTEDQLIAAIETLAKESA